MGNIGWGGGFYKFKTDLSMLNWIKTRTNHTCWKCNKGIPKGSNCLGGQYYKICLSCANEFLNSFLKGLDDYKLLVNKTKAYLELNGEEMKTNNAVAMI